MIPVVRGLSFASDRERDAYIIADNQLTMAGSWNFADLSTLLVELDKAGDVALDGLGFSKQELDALLGSTPSPTDWASVLGVDGDGGEPSTQQKTFILSATQADPLVKRRSAR
mgnify:FL=1